MKANTTNKTNKATKRGERCIPYEEMRRLMHTYGSIKCLRKRQNPAGEKTKINSIKRKFYRWFPDLEERFAKDENGHYQPKQGHEFEMLYREEMRTRDGESLSKKRVSCREKKCGSIDGKTKRNTNQPISPSSTATDCRRVSLAPADVAPDGTLSSPFNLNEGAKIIGMDITLDFDHDRGLSSSIVTDTEPADCSFVAEEGIFDYVDLNFYGPAEPMPKFPDRQCSSCSSGSEEASTDLKSSDNRSHPSLDDLLNKSMEECCEEILGSSGSLDDNDSVSGYLFDMISG